MITKVPSPDHRSTLDSFLGIHSGLSNSLPPEYLKLCVTLEASLVPRPHPERVSPHAILKAIRAGVGTETNWRQNALLRNNSVHFSICTFLKVKCGAIFVALFPCSFLSLAEARQRFGNDLIQQLSYYLYRTVEDDIVDGSRQACYMHCSLQSVPAVTRNCVIYGYPSSSRPIGISPTLKNTERIALFVCINQRSYPPYIPPTLPALRM